jgi:hypothetical protein
VIPGSWVADGEAASCDIALPPIPHSSSQLALLMWKARFTKTVMAATLIGHRPNSRSVDEIGKMPAVDFRRTDYD